MLDTAMPAADFEKDSAVKPGDTMTVISRSIQLLHRG
jgi:hypothetical protein